MQCFLIYIIFFVLKAHWITGLESDINELLADIYCGLVLAISDDCPVPAQPVALNSMSAGSFRGIVGTGAAITLAPKQVQYKRLCIGVWE